ncbi:hypothetical protein F7725_027646 [Dissostichus mawsoni]|uniref:Uncharacterized protein n=1 Tax=Dissostichus mawsoni TaxID=36200 RepID=A0A7J5XFU2_DISMA|nr:hypothetical protein F7725_027646 [Dissostichus mawsoni]
MALQLKDKDAYQRMNYLYQAAHCVLSQNPENVELARFYCFTQKTIARRLVLRQPISEENIMQKCCSLLIPGVTATTRQRRKNSKTRFTVLRCLSCGQSKTLLNDPNHCLWVDRPEALMEQQKQPDQGPSNKKQTKGKKPDGPVSSKPSAAKSDAKSSAST